MKQNNVFTMPFSVMEKEVSIMPTIYGRAYCIQFWFHHCRRHPCLPSPALPSCCKLMLYENQFQITEPHRKFRFGRLVGLQAKLCKCLNLLCERSQSYR
jgi:hypothetical protein